MTDDEILTPEVMSALGRRLAASRKPKELICPRCGKSFTKIGRGKWCSEACRIANYRAKKKKESANEQEG